MDKSVYRQVRKQNGEAFARDIRIYDNGIFDIPGIVEKLQYAGRDAQPLLGFLAGLKGVKIQPIKDVQDPLELLEKAGYDAFILKKQDDFKRLEPYFLEEEKICSFNDKQRLEDYYVVAAIKKNAHAIPRGNPPHREDNYGRSVITIQIWKGGGEIFITNRYNHGSIGQPVDNPDNTFYSNPDNIIEGLGSALKHTFHVDFSSKEQTLPSNFSYVQDKIVYYHTCREGVLYGVGCYVKEGHIFPLDRDYQFIVEDCIVDLKEKKAFSPTQSLLASLIHNEIQGKTLQVRRDKQKNQVLYADNHPLMIFDKGKIKTLHLVKTQVLSSNTIENLNELTSFKAPTLVRVESGNFRNCMGLKSIEIPEVQIVGNHCFKGLLSLKHLEIEKLEHIGDYSFSYLGIEEFNAPSLLSIGFFSLATNYFLTKMNIPLCQTLGKQSVKYLPSLRSLNLNDELLYSQVGFQNGRFNDVILSRFGTYLQKNKNSFKKKKTEEDMLIKKYLFLQQKFQSRRQ